MNTHYTRIAQALHWLMAVLLIGLLSLGFYMADLPLSPDKLQLYAWHKWTGVTVFLLVWLRLFWRLTHTPPAYPDSLSPLTGWLMSTAKGFQTGWWGIWPIPDLLSKDKELGHSLQELHEALNWLLLVLIVGHLAVALKHHWIDRDTVLTRMLHQGKKDD